MDTQDHGSPQTDQATPARQNKNRRGRSRKSNNFQQGNHASDSASPAAAQHTPKPRQQQKHNPQSNAVNSPRNTRNYNAIPATPLKEQAYAGPTFHASPDPSSLPIPKFFRKTPVAPPSPGKESDEDISPPASPSKHSANTLDLFFAADRKERATREQGRQAQALETYDQRQPGMYNQPRPQSSDVHNWKQSFPAPPVADNRAPFGNPQQQTQSSPRRARAGDRDSNGQIDRPNQAQPKTAQDMADDLKRILKIG